MKSLVIYYFVRLDEIKFNYKFDYKHEIVYANSTKRPQLISSIIYRSICI